MEVPDKPPDPYIVVEKTGGSEVHFLYSAMIAVQSIAGTLYESAALNERVKEVMRDIAFYTDVAKCSLNSDYNYTDTTTKRYRYQAVFHLYHY